MFDRCPVRLYRCCGEGIARCEKYAGHDGEHYAWPRGERYPLEWP